MRIFRNTILIITLVIAFAGFPSFAQVSISKISTGKITGLILDPNNARIAYARIVIEDKNLTRKIKANEWGEYEVILPHGEYQIFAEMDGFHSSKAKKLCVVENKTIEYNFTLEGIRNDAEHP